MRVAVPSVVSVCKEQARSIRVLVIARGDANIVCKEKGATEGRAQTTLKYHYLSSNSFSHSGVQSFV
jgi:hypothetical protein